MNCSPVAVQTRRGTHSTCVPALGPKEHGSASTGPVPYRAPAFFSSAMKLVHALILEDALGQWPGQKCLLHSIQAMIAAAAPLCKLLVGWRVPFLDRCLDRGFHRPRPTCGQVRAPCSPNAFAAVRNHPFLLIGQLVVLVATSMAKLITRPGAANFGKVLSRLRAAWRCAARGRPRIARKQPRSAGPDRVGSNRTAPVPHPSS